MGKSGASSCGNSSSNFLVFRPKPIQSTILGPRLMFWVVSHHLVAASAPLRKSGPRMSFWHEFRPMKLFSRFSTKTLPIHYVRSETHVLGGFAPFGSSKCRLAKSGPGMPFWHEFGLTKLLSSFLAKTHPIHYFRSKTHILGGFAPFVCRKNTIAKSSPGMPFGLEFGPMKLLLSFTAKTLL